MKQRTFNTARISALSDGVFAIAMTLLVLDLKLPDVGSNLPAEVFANTLKNQGPRFLSWLLSFAIICRLWMTQHSLLAAGDNRSRAFAGWNFLFLGTISFLPFSTSLLSEHYEQWLSVAIFSSSLALGGIALFGMTKANWRHSAEAKHALNRASAFRAVIILLITATVSTGVAFLSPPIGASVWIAFPVIATLSETWKEK